MRRYIDNRPEIGDTLTLRPLIRKLREVYPNDEVIVRTDPHGLLADLGVPIADRCCVICGETAYEPVLDTPYSKCKHCGFWYQHPVPTPRYENPVNENKGHLMREHDKRVNRELAKVLYAKHLPASALDVGSKYPYLLHCLKELGVRQVQGIDGCEKALEYGKELGVPMEHGNFLTYFPATKFELITMIHLIEHFPDPRLAVRKAKSVLKPGGTLFIRTPCTDGDVSRDLTEEHFTIHPVLFNQEALLSLLEQEGFEYTNAFVNPTVGQIDVTATYRKDSRTDPILYQWTNKHPRGDYLRRAKHFYQFPFSMAQEIGWLPTDDYEKPSLPLLPDVRPLKLPDRYVVINAECGGVARRWPVDRWKRLIQWLITRGVEVVTIGKMPFAFKGTHELSGCLSVLESAAVIKNANLTISADTSAAHLSSILGVTAIALMGPADARHTFTDDVTAIYRADKGCSGCYHRLPGKDPYDEGQQPPIHYACDFRDSACMANITVHQVIDAVSELLGISQHNKGLLSVCMMAKNEDHNVEAALTSVLDLADEVIFVDTGSTDSTKEVVEKTLSGRDYKIVDYNAGEPIRSFSEVRNAAFAHASCRYVMWLDAGDRVSNGRKLRKIVRAMEADSYSLQTVYGGLTYWRERIALRVFAEFVDDVHETMRIDGMTSQRVKDVHVKHIWSQKKGREQSLERNVRMLKAMIDREGPGHDRYARWVYYYARDLSQMGNNDEALVQFQKRTGLGGFWEERALAATNIARIHMDRHQYQEAILAAYDALKICDGWRDPYYILGDAYFWLGNYRAAARWFEHCMQIARPQTALGVWNDVYTWLPQCQLSYCFERLGRKKDALKWAREEREHAPVSQHARIDQRIVELSKK